MDLFKENLKQHYSRRRVTSQGKSRHRFSYSRSGRLRKTNRRSVVLTIAGSIVAAAALVLVAVFVVIPALGNKNVPTSTATATPTPVEKHPADMSALQKEMVLIKSKNISYPSLYGKKLIYSEGTDAVGGLRLANVNIFNTEDSQTEEVTDIDLQNDNIFELHANDNWIIWFDAKKTGGGAIYAYDRDKKESPEVIKVKTCYFAMPKLNLYENYIVWIEQTGSNMDKLFVCDLVSQESTTVKYYEKTPYGSSAAYVYDGKIYWAGPDPESTSADGTVSSLIYSLPLDSTTAIAQPETYRPGTYINDPKTNGKVMVWSNANKSPAATLYYSIGGGAPKELASKVTQYGVGDTFVAYTTEANLWLYFYDEQKYCRLTRPDEKAALADVAGNVVVWFDVTDETYERNVLKYALVD